MSSYNFTGREARLRLQVAKSSLPYNGSTSDGGSTGMVHSVDSRDGIRVVLVVFTGGECKQTAGC